MKDGLVVRLHLNCPYPVHGEKGIVIRFLVLFARIFGHLSVEITRVMVREQLERFDIKRLRLLLHDGLIIYLADLS